MRGEHSLTVVVLVFIMIMYMAYRLETDRECTVFAIVEFISFYIVFHSFFEFAYSTLQGSPVLTYIPC